MRSWELGTSKHGRSSGARLETEEKAMLRKMETAPNPGRVGERGRGREGFSGSVEESLRWRLPAGLVPH